MKNAHGKSWDGGFDSDDSNSDASFFSPDNDQSPGWLQPNTTGAGDGSLSIGFSASTLPLVAPVTTPAAIGQPLGVQGAAASAGLTINIIWDASVSRAPAGFETVIEAAVQYLESVFTNPVTININVGWGKVDGISLDSGDLGESLANYVTESYSAVRAALLAQNAPGASTLPANSPFSGTLTISTAEAKALGLMAASTALDGWVGFSSSEPFSYSTTAVPTSTEYYLLGVVEHEITEDMGRVSLIGAQNNAAAEYSVMDLYRYSAAGQRDLTTGHSGATAYFSVNNGTTNLGSWNNNPNNGDLGDWYPSGPAAGGDDAYNDFSNPGVIDTISTGDSLLMNAIGWVAAPAALSISSIAEAPPTGDLNPGKTVTITLTFNEIVTVAGGTPTLTLNDGGTATYTGGSGSAALTFSYIVGVGDTNVAALMANSVNLLGATIEDGGGNAASLTLTGLTQAGPQIDTTVPTLVSTVATSPASGSDLDAGKIVTFHVTLSEAVTVTGTPTLTLNDGGVASYASGTGTSVLTFTYTVLAGDNTTDLTVTSLAVPGGASIADAAGNVLVSPAGAPDNTGIKIDTAAPTVTILSSGGTVTGPAQTVAGTVDVADSGTTVTVLDGTTPVGTALVGSNGAWSAPVTLPGNGVFTLVAADTDAAGNTGTSGTDVVFTLNVPFAASIASTPASGGDLNAGKVVTFHVTMSEAVTVTGTPTLTLNDGAAASYTSGSGTDILTFTYTVAATQNSADLQVTGLTLPGGASIVDGGSHALVGPDPVTENTGLTIDTSAPVVAITSGGGTVTGPHQTVSGTVDMADAGSTVKVLDGVTQIGSALVGSTGAWSAAVTLPGNGTHTITATDTDGAGNVGTSGNSIGFTLNAPFVASVASTPPAGNDFTVGKIVTFTATMSEVVTVTGTPTLTLNDGGVATYSGGSGTNLLTFAYTVLAGQNSLDLATATLTLPSGASIVDGSSNALVSPATTTDDTGIVIDTATPTLSITTGGGTVTQAGQTITGIADTGDVGSLVKVMDGTTQIGSATVAATGAWTASVTLSADGVNTLVATDTDGAGNTGTSNQVVFTLNAPGPFVTAIVATSPSGADLDAGKVVTFTATMNEVVTVTGTPTLTLNDGATASYTGGTGTATLTFAYTVAAGQNIGDLQVTGLTLPSGATIKDSSHEAVASPAAAAADTGINIDTTAPVVTIGGAGGTVATASQALAGTGEAGTALTLFDNASAIAILTVGSDGTWSTTVTLAGAGTNTLSASDTDAAGNVGTSNNVVFDLNGVGGIVIGTLGADAFSASGGNHFFFGDGGHDTLTFDGASSQYDVSNNGYGTLTVTDTVPSRDGVNETVNVEILQFTDKTVFVENNDGAAIARLYAAALNRAPDAIGLGSWDDIYAAHVGAVGATAELDNVAAGFVNSTEFQALYGTLSDQAFVTQLYLNALHRAPDTAGLDYWVQHLQDGALTEAQVLIGFAESTENIADTNFLENPSTGWLIPDGTIPLDLPTVTGTPGNDTFVTLGDNATVNGAGGHDMIVFRGSSGDYLLSENADSSLTIADSVAGRDGTDTAIGIQYLEFNDKTVFVETATNANIARLYTAAFARLPDQDGLNNWEDIFAAQAPIVGTTAELVNVANGFVNSTEFQNLYGSLSDTAFVTQLYLNALHRAPDTAGLDSWVQFLQNGTMSQAQVVIGFAESAENIANTAFSHSHSEGWLFTL